MTSITTETPLATPSRLGETARILLAVLAFVALVAAATLTWGLPGLAMSALACVPVIFVVLLMITVGK